MVSTESHSRSRRTLLCINEVQISRLCIRGVELSTALYIAWPYIYHITPTI
jgi:hypothetical protein